MLMRRAHAKGIVVVHAAGNDDTGAQATLTGPAAEGGTIHVGNVDAYATVSRTNDRLDNASSRGKRCSDSDADMLDELMPHIAAPGTAITFPFPLNAMSEPCSSCYCGGTGTSYAAPHISGIIALMLELRPCLKPTHVDDARIRNILINSTEYRTETDRPPPQLSESGYFGRTWNNGWGYGYVDAYEALNHASQITC